MCLTDGRGADVPIVDALNARVALDAFSRAIAEAQPFRTTRRIDGSKASSHALAVLGITGAVDGALVSVGAVDLGTPIDLAAGS